jgi:hypothetical protein
VTHRCRKCRRFLGRDRHGRPPELRTFCDRRCTGLARVGRPNPHQPKAIRAWRRRRQAFDAVVLDHVDQRLPKLPFEIHRELLADWGRVTIRTLHRSLARAAAARAIVRVSDGYVLARARRAAA